MISLPSRPSQRLLTFWRLTEVRQERERPQVKGDINVTPLVDVVLVLLIIFMVVTPLIASGVAVDLPRTTFHLRKPDDGRDIIISVTHDQRIYVGAARLASVEALGAAVQAERRKFPDKTIFVKGDLRTPYKDMRNVMQALHAADIDEIILGTEELNEQK